MSSSSSRHRGERPANGRMHTHAGDFAFHRGRNNPWAYGSPPSRISSGYAGSSSWSSDFGREYTAQPRRSWYPGEPRRSHNRFAVPNGEPPQRPGFHQCARDPAFGPTDSRSIMLHGVQDFKVALENASATLTQLRDDFNTRYDNLENFTDSSKSGIWREALGRRNGLRPISKGQQQMPLSNYRPAYELQRATSTLKQNLDEVTTVETFVADPVVRGEPDGVSEVYRTILRVADEVIGPMAQARDSFRALNMAISTAKHLQDYLEGRRTLWETQEEFRDREETRKAVDDLERKRQRDLQEIKAKNAPVELGEHAQEERNNIYRR